MLCFGILVLIVATFSAEGLSPGEEELENVISRSLPTIEYEDRMGFTPLHVASKKCHLEVVQVLIDFGADPLLVDGEENTPLHQAVGCPNVTSYLVQFGSELDARNRNGATPLHLAVRAMDIGSVRVLLKYGALTNIEGTRQVSAVDEVLASMDQDLLDLFKLNATITASTPKTTHATTTTEKVPYTFPKPVVTTPLPEKALTKKPKPLRVTLKRPSGKEIELLTAAKQGLEGKITDLCSDGMDPNFADVTDNNHTPLHLATTAKAYASMLTLIACGAKVDSIDRDGRTPLHIAVTENDSWGAAVLLMRGADPYLVQRDGTTAYQTVKKNEDIGTMSVFNEKLLAWYNDVRPLTPIEKELHMYTKMGRYASGVAKTCLSGLNVNIKDAENKQRTALHLAVYSDYNIIQTVMMLVRCGGNVNARDVDGNTPLHLAAIEGKDQVFTGLLLHKADPFMVNFEGKTAHQLAMVSKSGYIVYTAKFGSHRYEWFMNNKFM